MAKSIPISQIVDEFHYSISATVRKQRRIRSGTFWSKFKFERRTRDRIEAVRTALEERRIKISLENSLFGSEKRSELLVLRLQDSMLPIDIAIPHTAKELTGNRDEIDDLACENVHKFDRIEAKLKHLAEVRHVEIDVTFTFSDLFRELFWNDTPGHYELSPGVFGASPSNWTYHIALAIKQACKILNLTCRFEAHGKRDAIIEEENEEKVSQVILAAEWEWDYESIFGKGKELDKLKATCKSTRRLMVFYWFIVRILNI